MPVLIPRKFRTLFDNHQRNPWYTCWWAHMLTFITCFPFFTSADGGIFARYYSNIYQTAVVESSTYILVCRYFLCMLPGMFILTCFIRELKPPFPYCFHTSPNPESIWSTGMVWRGGPKLLGGGEYLKLVRYISGVAPTQRVQLS